MVIINTIINYLPFYFHFNYKDFSLLISRHQDEAMLLL
jgi:hypothetical protein